MIEYTRKDIIMDPNDPRLEGAIGKKVYSSSDINLLLHRANNDEHEMTLTQVEDVDFEPFTVTDMNEHDFDADFIIIKKEEPKPEYVPFESKGEFIKSYMDNRIDHEYLDHQISCLGGIWLKDKDREGAYFMVTEIWNEGVVVSDFKMKTTKEGNDEYYTTNENTEWKELLRDYTFLDGSPCGKEVK